MWACSESLTGSQGLQSLTVVPAVIMFQARLQRNHGILKARMCNNKKSMKLGYAAGTIFSRLG